MITTASKVALLVLVIVGTSVYAEAYRGQTDLDDEINTTSSSLGFLEFDSESSMGETSRCQLQYRYVVHENLYKAGLPQIVQGSVTSDYYENKPINFILNIQPLRLEFNSATYEASSVTLDPQHAALIINGQDFGKFQLQPIDCESGLCIAYAPKTGDEIVTMIKAVQSRPIFDAEIAYATSKSTARQVVRLSNVPTHGITNPEIRKQFTRCLDGLLKKEINDISKFVQH